MGVVRARSATCRFTLKKSKVKKLKGNITVYGKLTVKGKTVARRKTTVSLKVKASSTRIGTPLHPHSHSGSEDVAGPRLNGGGPLCP